METIKYKEFLGDLGNGMAEILKRISNPKDLNSYNKALEAKHIQEARIDFFKKGYALRDAELEEQKKIEDWGDNNDHHN